MRVPNRQGSWIPLTTLLVFAASACWGAVRIFSPSL
jgi:hypothetical protein